MPTVGVPQTLPIGGNSYPYTALLAHRNGNTQHKSQWIIGPADEISCFIRTITCGWLDGTEIGWGMKTDEQRKMEVIGYDRFTSDLKIAKFVGDGGHWHGYPVDHRKKPKDRPNERILLAWMDEGVLDKSKMAKVKSGKQCNL